MLERGRRFPFPLCCPWFCSLRYCIHVVWVSLWLPLGRWGSLLFRAVSVYYVFSLSVCTVVYRRPLSFLGLGYVSAGVVVVGWGCSFGPVTWRAFCFFPFSPCVAPFLLLLDSSRSRGAGGQLVYNWGPRAVHSPIPHLGYCWLGLFLSASAGSFGPESFWRL